MITLPMKCKICGKTISPPDEALIIGEAPQVRNQKILHKLYCHVQGEMEQEAKYRTPQAMLARPVAPHTQALIAATVAGENLKGAMLIGNFEISPDMETERQGVLARVHEITRTVRVSDDDLWPLAELAFDPENGFGYANNPEAVHFVLQDLRDRYERLGKYAPAQPAAAPQPEEVKK